MRTRYLKPGNGMSNHFIGFIPVFFPVEILVHGGQISKVLFFASKLKFSKFDVSK